MADQYEPLNPNLGANANAPPPAAPVPSPMNFPPPPPAANFVPQQPAANVPEQAPPVAKSPNQTSNVVDSRAKDAEGEVDQSKNPEKQSNLAVHGNEDVEQPRRMPKKKRDKLCSTLCCLSFIIAFVVLVVILLGVFVGVSSAQSWFEGDTRKVTISAN